MARPIINQSFSFLNSRKLFLHPVRYIETASTLISYVFADFTYSMTLSDMNKSLEEIKRSLQLQNMKNTIYLETILLRNLVFQNYE